MTDNTKSAELAERELFEKWAKSKHENLGGEFGGPGAVDWWYWDDSTAADWDVWQARAALDQGAPSAVAEGSIPKRSWSKEAEMMESWASREAAPEAPAAASVKDHVLREVVNSLRDTAIEFHAHGSLRDRLSQCLDPLLAQQSTKEASHG